MKKRFILNFSMMLSFSLILLSQSYVSAEKRGKKEKKSSFPNVSISALNYYEGEVSAVPGASFPISIDIKSEGDFPGFSHYSVKIGFYLVNKDDISRINSKNIQQLGHYFGYVSLNSPKKGGNHYNERIKVNHDLTTVLGEYYLYGLVDPWNNLNEKKIDNLYASDLTVTIASQDAFNPKIQITDFKPDLRGIILDRETKQSVNGQLSLEGNFSNFEYAQISFCMVEDEITCSPLKVWDPEIKGYSDSFNLYGLESGDELTTLFDVQIPDNLIDSLLPDIAKPRGDTFTLRMKVEASPDTDKTLKLETYKDISLNLLPPLETSPYLLTDLGSDLKYAVSKRRQSVKYSRRSNNSKSVRTYDKDKAQVRSLRFISLIKKIIAALKKAATPPPPPRNQFINQMVLASNPKSSIPGSRFNMPNSDFPWLQNLKVEVPPPPERYNGNGFPSIAEYRRCIPFFCGARNREDVGRAPSEACIRQYCGTTEEDIKYGGRNPNLFDLGTGFDYDFSKGGFGARVGLSGRVNIFKDNAIINYIGGSYSNSAFFGVKVFGYSVPIFEAFSQTVYSPTELFESRSQSVMKILGRTVEKEEKRSEELSESFSVTYGFKKSAEIGIGPFDVDVSLEAGGTLQVTFRIRAGTDGITGSVEPEASIGVEGRVSAGPVSLSAALQLISDVLETSLNLNVALDLARKVIAPELTLSIVNILTGPNGSIKLSLDYLFDTYRVTIASFSSGEFRKTLYDKSTKFSEIRF